MKTTKALDVSDLYELIFKFDERVDSSFQETGTELDSIRSRLARRGQEIANLEGGYESLEKEVEALKDRLNEWDEAIAELRGVVDFLTNKRCRCNDDKVTLGADPYLPRGLIESFLRVFKHFALKIPRGKVRVF